MLTAIADNQFLGKKKILFVKSAIPGAVLICFQANALRLKMFA
jgi:hypothetical protein